MKARKKPLLFMIAALLTMNVIAASALAVDIPKTPTDDTVVTPMSEQTEWVYRYNNGVLEKRLWSNTYAVWLTDWIKV